MEHRPDHPINGLRSGLIRGLLAGLVAVLIAGPILVMVCQPALALAWTLPGRIRAEAEGNRPLSPTPPGGPLQEVAPPLPVQQLQEALDAHAPLLAIEHPRDGEMLPAGPWELTLRVRDWPVVDAGGLGLGAHVVVQIDDQPPLRLASADRAAEGRSAGAGAGTSANEGIQMSVQVPPLAPGSHRITAYAARPWGEAVKSPGAARQIRVHRVAANPASIPAPDSPQLLPVSPTELSIAEPVLLDWLLLDAPLQNLRNNDGSWRLRVTINGDSFLVDHNVPLWLKGWKRGSNSLQLDLVNGSGEPLNPPFNSLVQEVILEEGNAFKQERIGEVALAPRWLQGRLSPIELAQLLGEAPAEPVVQAAPVQPAPEQPPGTIQTPGPPSDRTPAEMAPIEMAPIKKAPVQEAPIEDTLTEETLGEKTLGEESPAEEVAVTERPAEERPVGERPVEVAPAPKSAVQADPMDPFIPMDPSIESDELVDEALNEHPTPGSETSKAIPETGIWRDSNPSITRLPLQSPSILNPTIANPAAPTIANPERIRTSSAVVGSARDQVNPDGSLIRPKPQGPLAGLRQRLNP